MPWVKIDDDFAQHPKLVRAGPLGMAMQIAALCYCNRHLTDGFIPKQVAGMLLSFDGLGMRMWSAEHFGGGEDAVWTLVVDDLVQAGVWDAVENGWQIHDYLDYQPSAASIRLERKKTKDRVSQWRQRRNGVTNGVGNGVGTPAPVPVPVKDTNTDRESTSQHTAGFDKPAAGRKANGQAAGARYPAWFEAIWTAYRPIASPNSSKSRALTAAKRLSEKDREHCRAGLAGYVAWLRKERAKRSDFPAQHLATFINGRGWEAFSEQNAQAAAAVSDAEMQRIVDTINAEREREEQADDLAAH